MANPGEGEPKPRDDHDTFDIADLESFGGGGLGAPEAPPADALVAPPAGDTDVPAAPQPRGLRAEVTKPGTSTFAPISPEPGPALEAHLRQLNDLVTKALEEEQGYGRDILPPDPIVRAAFYLQQAKPTDRARKAVFDLVVILDDKQIEAAKAKAPDDDPIYWDAIEGLKENKAVERFTAEYQPLHDALSHYDHPPVIDESVLLQALYISAHAAAVPEAHSVLATLPAPSEYHLPQWYFEQAVVSVAAVPDTELAAAEKQALGEAVDQLHHLILGDEIKTAVRASFQVKGAPKFVELPIDPVLQAALYLQHARGTTSKAVHQQEEILYRLGMRVPEAMIEEARQDMPEDDPELAEALQALVEDHQAYQLWEAYRPFHTEVTRSEDELPEGIKQSLLLQIAYMSVHPEKFQRQQTRDRFSEMPDLRSFPLPEWYVRQALDDLERIPQEQLPEDERYELEGFIYTHCNQIHESADYLERSILHIGEAGFSRLPEYLQKSLRELFGPENLEAYLKDPNRGHREELLYRALTEGAEEEASQVPEDFAETAEFEQLTAGLNELLADALATMENGRADALITLTEKAGAALRMIDVLGLVEWSQKGSQGQRIGKNIALGVAAGSLAQWCANLTGLGQVVKSLGLVTTSVNLTNAAMAKHTEEWRKPPNTEREEETAEPDETGGGNQGWWSQLTEQEAEEGLPGELPDVPQVVNPDGSLSRIALLAMREKAQGAGAQAGETEAKEAAGQRKVEIWLEVAEQAAHLTGHRLTLVRSDPDRPVLEIRLPYEEIDTKTVKRKGSAEAELLYQSPVGWTLRLEKDLAYTPAGAPEPTNEPDRPEDEPDDPFDVLVGEDDETAAAIVSTGHHHPKEGWQTVGEFSFNSFASTGDLARLRLKLPAGGSLNQEAGPQAESVDHSWVEQLTAKEALRRVGLARLVLTRDERNFVKIRAAINEKWSVEDDEEGDTDKDKQEKAKNRQAAEAEIQAEWQTRQADVEIYARLIKQVLKEYPREALLAAMETRDAEPRQVSHALAQQFANETSAKQFARAALFGASTALASALIGYYGTKWLQGILAVPEKGVTAALPRATAAQSFGAGR